MNDKIPARDVTRDELVIIEAVRDKRYTDADHLIGQWRDNPNPLIYRMAIDLEDRAEEIKDFLHRRGQDGQ